METQLDRYQQTNQPSRRTVLRTGAWIAVNARKLFIPEGIVQSRVTAVRVLPTIPLEDTDNPQTQPTSEPLPEEWVRITEEDYHRKERGPLKFAGALKFGMGSRIPNEALPDFAKLVSFTLRRYQTFYPEEQLILKQECDGLKSKLRTNPVIDEVFWEWHMRVGILSEEPNLVFGQYEWINFLDYLGFNRNFMEMREFRSSSMRGT